MAGAGRLRGARGRLRQPAAAARPCRVECLRRHRRHPPRAKGRPGAGRPPRLVRHPRHARSLRRLCGAHRAGGRGRALARRAVLHLARRPGWLADVRGAVAGRRARRARAPAARRRRHRRHRPGAGRAGRAPPHRAAPVQPLPAARVAHAGLSGRLAPAEPAHAQQVLHRRQPGQRGRRAQHRQRVFRRGRRDRLRRPGRAVDRPGGAAGVGAVRPLLEQRVGLSCSGPRRPGAGRCGGDAARALCRCACRPAGRGLPAGGARGRHRRSAGRAQPAAGLDHRAAAGRRAAEDAGPRRRAPTCCCSRR